MTSRILKLIIIAATVFLSACAGGEKAPPPPEFPLTRVESSQWPILLDDPDPAGLLNALEQSRVYLRKLPPDRTFKFGPDSYSAAHLLSSLTEFEDLYTRFGPGQALTEALKRDFTLYQSIGSNGKGRVVCTGYYEPLLKGSMIQDETYNRPLYGPPDDIVTADLGEFLPEMAGKKIYGRLDGTRLKPYFSRSDIDQRGVLDGRDLEILWVDDSAALFFLHIQGSGRIELPDGWEVRVGFAGSNGRPYRSVGRLLLDKGLLTREEMSMQAIRDWLRKNPDKAQAAMNWNERYIFFRVLDGPPVGSINVPLTPGRSAAADASKLPKSALAWLEVEIPGGKVGDADEPFRKSSRFLLIQDAGGAIKGPGRLDLFFGHGAEAEWQAGRMKEPGRLFFLIKKTGDLESGS